MSKKPLPPSAALAWLASRWKNQHRNWFDRGGTWPLDVPLAAPDERAFLAAPAAQRAWARAWTDWHGGGEVLWETRRWARAGEQRVPTHWRLRDAHELARVLGQERRWMRACERRDAWERRWPQLAPAVPDAGPTDSVPGADARSGVTAAAPASASDEDAVAAVPGLGRFFDAFADYDDADFARLGETLAWLLAHPDSGLYLRELPIVGVDTKWLETRKGLVLALLGRLRGQRLAADLHAACGLRRAPPTVRLKVLCPRLREATAGLTHLEAPVPELARLPLRPRVALVLENQTTGWALPDVPGAVAFIGLGHAVALLADIAWLRDVPVVYWGDLDTHGLVILARARRALGRVHPVLMDEATLLRYREFWVRESPHPPAELPEWTAAERAVFQALRARRWGEHVRLEQERLPWPEAWPQVRAALERHGAAAGPDTPSAPA
jgi:hypothetical protein